MDTGALAVAVGAATLAAVTAYVEPADVPAVKTPWVLMLPPLAVQVTLVLELPVTVAVKATDCPGCRTALPGEMVTTTCCTGGGGDGAELPPQPLNSQLMQLMIVMQVGKRSFVTNGEMRVRE